MPLMHTDIHIPLSFSLLFRFAQAIYKHRGPYIDQSKVCMNGINGFDRTFGFLNADYNHITESLDEFYKIIGQCQLGSHNTADEQKVHENNFQADFHKPVSTLELTNELKTKQNEMKLSINALNCRLSGMQGQQKSAFSVDDADEKFLKIFQAKFDKIVKTYDDMSVKIAGHRKEHINNFSRLAVLDKDCSEMFKRIERCILVLSKDKLVPDNANIDTDIYPVKILVRICAFKKCNKAIYKVLSQLKELMKEIKTCDVQFSSLLYEIGNVKIASEFLLSKTEYESLQNKTDMNIDAKGKMKNLTMYILNLMDSLKRQLSLEIETYTRKAIEADYMCRKMSKNNLSGRLNLKLSNLIRYVREIFGNDKLLEVFNELICTFCKTSNTEANLLDKQYRLKNRTSSTPEFKELLNEYYKFALEIHARRNDKQLETSEIFLTLIQSKYCIFKLRKNITFISGKLPGDDILVNLLSDKMFKILGTFYASNQYLYREDKEYKKVDNIIIEKLGTQASFLMETETLRQSIDSTLVLSRNSVNNADVDTVSTALSDFTNAKIEVENILVKQSDHRAQRYQSRGKDVADGKNCCDEQEQNTLHNKKTDRCILLEKNLDKVNKIIDNLYADTKKIVHKNTIAQDIKHDSFCIDSDLSLLKSIKKVYEEDLKIVCYKSHLKLAEDQRTKYYNEMQQNHQIASLATRDTGILDLAIDLMISHGNKMQLMKIINKVTLCPEQTFGNPAVAASQSIKTVKTEHVRTLSNGSTISLDKYRNVGNAIDCFRQFYAINLSIFDSKRRETAKQNHSCDPTSADLQSILIFIDVYLKRKELLSVRKNENMSKETFDAYKSWLKRLGAVCISSTKEIDYKMSRILEVQTVQMQQITQKKQQPSTPSVSKNQSTAVLDLHQLSQNHVAVDDASFFGQNKMRKILLISGIAVVIVFGVICGLNCLTKMGFFN